jgi:ATP-dependent DNA helicase DinG
VTEPSVAELLRQVVAALPAGEVRTGQVEMAEVVAKALGSGGHVAVTAGTGTGKSLAYLVPAVDSHKRVVVATATKALQDQLANHDLPLVARGLGRPVKWAVLKGRSNYLCRQRLHEFERLGEQQRFDAPLDAAPDLPPDAEAFDAEPPDAGRGARPSGSARAIAARRIGEEVRRLAAWAESTGSGDPSVVERERHRRRMSWSPSLSVGRRVLRGGGSYEGSRRGHRRRESPSSRR